MRRSEVKGRSYRGSASARHVDVDFVISWGCGKESMRPDPPTHTHLYLRGDPVP